MLLFFPHLQSDKPNVQDLQDIDLVTLERYVTYNRVKSWYD